MQLAILVGTLARSQERIQQPLVHREVTLSLPTLAVNRFDLLPILVQEAPVKRGRLVCLGILRRPAAQRRDYSDHVQRLVEESMVMLAVIPDVGQQRFETMTSACGARQRMELD